MNDLAEMSSVKRAGSAGPARSHWKPAAWQGVSLYAPADWNMVAYGGDYQQGNIRLDNSDLTRKSAFGMELRWITARRAQRDTDLEARIKALFESIKRDNKKTKQTAHTETQLFRDAQHADRAGSRSFSWRADRKAQGRIWYCETCKRVVIAQVVGDLQTDFGTAAKDVLNSIACHPDTPDWRTWSLYDLFTETPDSYQLKGKPKLMNIYVQLGFERPRTLDTITVEQWSVANMQLRGKYLDEWFQSKNQALEMEVRYDIEESGTHDHIALAINGKRTGMQYWMSRAIPQIMRFQRPAVHYAACLWECPASNKIYLVQSFTRRPEPELLEEIVSRTVCH